MLPDHGIIFSDQRETRIGYARAKGLKGIHPLRVRDQNDKAS